MSRASVLELCDMLRDDLSPTTRKSAALTMEEEVLLSLKELASRKLSKLRQRQHSRFAANGQCCSCLVHGQLDSEEEKFYQHA